MSKRQEKKRIAYMRSMQERPSAFRFRLSTFNSLGMSLIETLIAITIFAILALVAVTVFFTLTKNQTKNNISNDTYTEAQALLKDMTDTIKQARSIQEDIGCTSEDQLALLMNNDDVLVYKADSQNRLVLEHDCPTPTESEILSTPNINVEQLTFRVNKSATLNPDSVTISITIASSQNQSDKPQLRASTDLETTVVLRSY